MIGIALMTIAVAWGTGSIVAQPTPLRAGVLAFNVLVWILLFDAERERA